MRPFPFTGVRKIESSSLWEYVTEPRVSEPTGQALAWFFQYPWVNVQLPLLLLPFFRSCSTERVGSSTPAQPDSERTSAKAAAKMGVGFMVGRLLCAGSQLPCVCQGTQAR